MKHKNVWIRLAVSRERIEGGNPHHWRCFIDPSIEEIPLKELSLAGDATVRNWLTRSQTTRDERGVVAWIHFFGDIEIHDGAGYAILREPPPTRPKEG